MCLSTLSRKHELFASYRKAVSLRDRRGRRGHGARDLGGTAAHRPGGAFQRLLTISDVCNLAKSVFKIEHSRLTTCKQVLLPPDYELVLLT